MSARARVSSGRGDAIYFKEFDPQLSQAWENIRLFVSSLIKQRLIDDCHLFINPAPIGNGMTIFKELNNKQDLNLVKAKSFDCGIVVLNYEPKLT
ncbi:MAG: dihydrofolate reductase family protein [Gammaproteobacteria bacterium]|nr:dihydrofolate reductase family protein [Gammaproteobacteria bacterium]